MSQHRKMSHNSASSPQQSIGDAVFQTVSAVLAGRRKNYTVDRLRTLYADLLYLIDVANDDLGRRSLEDSERFNTQKEGVIKTYAGFLKRKIGLGRSYGDHRITSTPPRRELAAAFRVLSATPSPQKEGSNGGALAVRNNASVSALAMARARESRVVELIRSIGEVVVYGEQSAVGSRASLRGDAVFEYFCEKSILSLLVDIAKAKPSSGNGDETIPNFHAVAWTPLVKAQVLQTVAILISNVQDPTSLYYLLSNHHANELLRCMLPIRQWTDPALEEMMPIYVSFLKTLALKLAAAPDLFPFLKSDNPGSQTSSFALFSSALEVATGAFAQSDSIVHITCLNLLVNVLQISHPSVRSWVSAAEVEQKQLASHLCQRLFESCQRLATLTTGSAVDPVRSSAIMGQLTRLHNQFEFLNEVLWCGVRTLNVRICEFLLQRVVFRLLRYLMPQNEERRFAVGVGDGDTILESEAHAQASTLFLSQLFLSLDYAPFLRMLAVAILHPVSPEDWTSPSNPAPSSPDEYILTKALNSIVQDGNNEDTHVVANPFREKLLAILRGEEGDWRFLPAAMLLESVMKSDALDLGTLQSLNVIPRFLDEKSSYPPSPWECALKDFLTTQREKSSSVSVVALECAGALALAMLSHVVVSVTEGGNDFSRSGELFSASPLVQGLDAAHSNFCANAQNLQGATGVSDHFVDLIELEITSRYALRHQSNNEKKYGATAFCCSLAKFACTTHSRNPEVLVRKYRDVSSNDVEDARFALRMALHFRAISHAVQKLRDDLCSNLGPSVASSRWSKDRLQFDTNDIADELLLAIGGLKARPAIGTDLDLRGRATFRFSITGHRQEQIKPNRQKGDDVQKDNERKRKFSEDFIKPSTKELLLVLDPTDIFIVKPGGKYEENRGKILCSAPLSSIIAFAPDGEWLHIAIRQMEDIGYLVKNGNMALQFESVGTCLIARQYLERARLVLQRDLEQRIQLLFSEGTPKAVSPTKESQVADFEMTNDKKEHCRSLNDRPESTNSSLEITEGSQDIAYEMTIDKEHRRNLSDRPESAESSLEITGLDRKKQCLV